MSDPEITALREVIAKRVRSDDIGQRRRDIDVRGKAYKLAPDVIVEPVSANGVKAEWTSTPEADRAEAILYLHGGGYVIGSLGQSPSRRRRSRPGGAREDVGAGLSAGPGTPVPRGGRRCGRRLSLPAGRWRAARRHHHRRRLGWRRSRRGGDAGNTRRGPAATRVRLGRSRRGSTWKRSATA